MLACKQFSESPGSHLRLILLSHIVAELDGLLLLLLESILRLIEEVDLLCLLRRLRLYQVLVLHRIVLCDILGLLWLVVLLNRRIDELRLIVLQNRLLLIARHDDALRLELLLL